MDISLQIPASKYTCPEADAFAIPAHLYIKCGIFLLLFYFSTNEQPFFFSPKQEPTSCHSDQIVGKPCLTWKSSYPFSFSEATKRMPKNSSLCIATSATPGTCMGETFEVENPTISFKCIRAFQPMNFARCSGLPDKDSNQSWQSSNKIQFSTTVQPASKCILVGSWLSLLLDWAQMETVPP